jgi:hypothetical protein
VSPRDHMKRVQLESDVLKAKNLLAAAHVEYEMALGEIAGGSYSTIALTTLTVAVDQLVELECRHAVAVDRLEVFQREAMS